MANMDSILSHLKSGGTVLTPNRRLSAWLASFYHAKQTQEASTWQSPDVLPYSTWLTRLWDEFSYQTISDQPMLLSPTQEAYLWEFIVGKSEAAEHLLQVSQTAQTAQKAYALLQQWNLDVHHPLFDMSEDYRAFKAWALTFIETCRSNQWLSGSDLSGKIQELLNTGKLSVRQHILLYGFAELTPSMKSIQQHLEHQGLSFSLHELSGETSAAYQMSFEDVEEEITTAARWAKYSLEHHPAQTTAVVIPGLDTCRGKVKKIFSDVFGNETDYNITAGMPLAEYPVIKTALHLLSFNKATVSQHELSFVLASPFCGEAEKEQIRRAKLDARIRQDNLDSFDLRELKDRDSNFTNLIETYAPKLHQRLLNWLSLLDIVDTTRSYQDWTEFFCKQLHALGWPGERSMSSDEYQVVDKWFDALYQYTQLDQVAAPVSFKSAYSSLHQLMHKLAFQPKTPDSHIQVMGVLEAASVPFDAIWVAGLNDTTWPPQPSPNPFIPVRLQRDGQMPHANSLRELAYCEQITQQFQQCSSISIFSYARTIDKIEVAASPLIKSLNHYHALPLSEYQSLNEKLIGKVPLEVLKETYAPAVDTDERITGGVAVIKDQALCPFKAFATWRLHARALEEPLPGFRKKDRGTITHKILETIWLQLVSKAKLNLLSEQDLERLIKETIDDVMLHSPQAKPQRPEFLKLERTRLALVVKEWLEHEKRRPDFKVIESETATDITIGPLKLRARIDRIDEIAEGKHLIIDYKTSSSVNCNKWFDDRIEEPQLPVYLLHDDAAIGIAFAQVYTGSCKFEGVSESNLNIDGITTLERKQKSEPDWVQQTAKWNDNILTLANGFHQGDVTIDPKNNDTCNWCALHAICRIHEDITHVEA